MARDRFDRNDPVDRKMASDHAAQRHRTATSAGGYKSGPQFSDASITPSSTPTAPKPEVYDPDRYAWMSDEKALEEYKKVQVDLEAAKDDPVRGVRLIERQMYLMFLLMDRGLTPE